MVFLIAVITIASLYIIWLPLTAYGWVKAADIPENKHINPRLKCDGCVPALYLPRRQHQMEKKGSLRLCFRREKEYYLL